MASCWWNCLLVKVCRSREETTSVIKSHMTGVQAQHPNQTQSFWLESHNSLCLHSHTGD